MPTPHKGIVLYDYLLIPGGAEQVSIVMAMHFDATLCVGFIHEPSFQNIKTLPLKLIELKTRTPIHLASVLRTIYGFSHKPRFLQDYDWVIYSGSYAPLAVSHHTAGKNILYCHTIPRFAYDLQNWYLQRMPIWQRPLFKGLAHYVRTRYATAIQQMDCVIANSETVRQRIKTYLNIDAQVIHPPCSTTRFQWQGQQNYYLSLARLESYKRVDHIVTAFKQMPHKNLVVASGGSELKRLQSLAANVPNIRFTGWLAERELAKLVGNAIATIYLPIDEDFGMSPVESMAAGKPVIGVAEGGLRETIVNGETGILIAQEPKPENIINAVTTMSSEHALQMRTACQARAQLFNETVFYDKMQQIITSSS